MWPELIRKSKEGGLDVIETYVFWNYHEPVKGEVYDYLCLNDNHLYLQYVVHGHVSPIARYFIVW